MRTIHVAQKQRALPSHPFDVYCVWDKICAFTLNIQIFSAHAHRKAHGGINVLNKYPYIYNFCFSTPRRFRPGSKQSSKCQNVLPPLGLHDERHRRIETEPIPVRPRRVRQGVQRGWTSKDMLLPLHIGILHRSGSVSKKIYMSNNNIWQNDRITFDYWSRFMLDVFVAIILYRKFWINSIVMNYLKVLNYCVKSSLDF